MQNYPACRIKNKFKNWILMWHSTKKNAQIHFASLTKYTAVLKETWLRDPE